MSMLHDAAGGHDIKYKSEQILPLLRSLTTRWHRKKTRQAAIAAIHEVKTLRSRLSWAAIECSEWRYKVGGAAYTAKGPEFMAMVEQGIKDRIGEYIHLTDEDLYPGPGA